MNKERSAAITIGGKEYELVLTTRATKEIAGRYGYDNGSKFAKAFRDTVGMSPTEYRNAG